MPDDRTAPRPEAAFGLRWYAAAALVAALVHLPLLGNPYTMDDWSWINAFRWRPAGETLRSLFDPVGSLFYRPLAGLYKMAVVGVFGQDALASHVLAVLLLAGAMLLLARIVTRLSGDPVAGGAAGFAYGGMLGIHHDPLLWLVGVNELGTPLLVLLALDAALAGRRWRSGALVLAAVLFKESAAFAVVVAPLFLLAGGGRRPRGGRRWVALALPYLPAAATLAAVRAVAQSPLAVAPEHPYVFHAAWETPLRLGARYLQWTLEALLPGIAATRALEPASWWLAARPPAVAALLALGCAALWLASRSGLLAPAGAPRPAPAAPWLLAAWAALGLAPVLLMTNHVYRYYLAYSIGPVLGLVFWTLHALARRAVGDRRARVGAILAAAILCAAAAVEARRLPGPPGGPDPLPGGHNILLQRGRTVATVREGLARLLPDPPPGSVLVFAPEVEVEAFRRENGPQAWYRRGDLAVLALGEVSFGGGGLAAKAPYRGQFLSGAGGTAGRGAPGGDSLLLDPARTFFFAAAGGRLVPLSAAEAAARQAAEATAGGRGRD